MNPITPPVPASPRALAKAPQGNAPPPAALEGHGIDQIVLELEDQARRSRALHNDARDARRVQERAGIRRARQSARRELGAKLVSAGASRPSPPSFVGERAPAGLRAERPSRTPEPMKLSELKWDAAGLVTVVVQDQLSGEIRMLAHANLEALQATLKTGDAHFFSRSRGQLWRKGESSGNTIAVSEVWTDCDADAVLYLAAPAGPSCHTGRETCFFRSVTEAGVSDEEHAHGRPTLLALEAALMARANSTADKSYTKSLLTKGAGKIGEKIREEADEVSVAIAEEPDENVAKEAADVLYHLMVGLLLRKIPFRRVQGVLASRFGVSGHVEKASR